jgi:hypothetical protein
MFECGEHARRQQFRSTQCRVDALTGERVIEIRRVANNGCSGYPGAAHSDRKGTGSADCCHPFRSSEAFAHFG